MRQLHGNSIARSGDYRLGLGLGLAPEPADDETFSSWLHRCGVAYRHDDARSFVTSLRAADGLEPLADDFDFDITPAPELVNLLAARTAHPIARLQNLIAGRERSVLRPEYRDAYCPQCFREDVAAGVIYRRREWLNCWALTCRAHECLLGSYEAVARAKPLSGQSIALTETEQVRLGVSSLGCVTGFSPPPPWNPRDRRRSVQRKVEALARGDWLDLQMLNSENGRSLMLLAGSENSEKLYSIIFGEFRARRAFWMNQAGEGISWPSAKLPQARVRVRLLAAYTAAAIWPYLDHRGQVPSAPRWHAELVDLAKRQATAF